VGHFLEFFSKGLLFDSSCVSGLAPEWQGFLGKSRLTNRSLLTKMAAYYKRRLRRTGLQSPLFASNNKNSEWKTVDKKPHEEDCVRRRLIKRDMKGLVIELLLVTALLLTSTPTAVQADMPASQVNQSSGVSGQTNQEVPDQEAVGEPELPTNADEDPAEPVLYQFVATAYCLRGKTAAGIRANPGSVAADPAVLPIGSVIRLHAGEYSGIYTVLDTGPKMRGRRLDIWLPSYEEAIQFGVRKIKVEIIRYGWDPAEKEVSSL
jgi:3D (Asp-Asp-Asp) domain-containing protein